MDIPEPLIPVLGLIRNLTSLGFSQWYEVVYHNGDEWKPYFGSDTFYDGESVVNWRYAHQCMSENVDGKDN